MANHTQRGGVAVDAFQWLGGTLSTSTVTLPIWAKQLALHSPGDGTLHIPTSRGGLSANPTDWVVRISTGEVEVMSAATFAVLYS